MRTDFSELESGNFSVTVTPVFEPFTSSLPTDKLVDVLGLNLLQMVKKGKVNGLLSYTKFKIRRDQSKQVSEIQKRILETYQVFIFTRS